MTQRTEVAVLGEDGREPAVSATSASIERLEDEITTMCAHIGAAEHRLLRAIGEFDARKGWAGIGIASCAHWLNWSCGISLVAAHDKMRVARSLRTLPEISAAMGRGELSYSGAAGRRNLASCGRACGRPRGFRPRKIPRNSSAIPADFSPGALASALRSHNRSWQDYFDPPP